MDLVADLIRDVWTQDLCGGAVVSLLHDPVQGSVRLHAAQTRERDGKTVELESGPLYFSTVDGPETFARTVDAEVSDLLKRVRRELRGGWYTMKELA